MLTKIAIYLDAQLEIQILNLLWKSYTQDMKGDKELPGVTLLEYQTHS